MFSLPPELAPAVMQPQDRAGRRLWAQIRAGTPFDPWLPLLLHTWCLRAGAACEGRRLTTVVVTGFSASPHRRLARLVHAAYAVAIAVLAVRLGLETRLAGDLWGGGPAPPSGALEWATAQLNRRVPELPVQLVPLLPTAPGGGGGGEPSAPSGPPGRPPGGPGAFVTR